MSINKVIITGNLTRDPELRSTASGTPVLNLGVAVNDRRRNQQTGEWEDYPNFIDCTMFGTRAESVSRFLSKGSKVAIEGKLHWSQWERDGQKRSKLDVTVEEIVFMSQSQQQSYQATPVYGQQINQKAVYGQQQQMPPQQQAPMQQLPQQQMPMQQQVVSSVYDEDIPF